MAVRFYDEALTNKIQKWVKDPNLRVLKPSETQELFKIQADIKNDKPITLPLIALSRESKITLLNTNKQPKTYDGFKIRVYDKDNNEVHLEKTQKLNAIPMQLEYQLDIYTQDMAECDEYLRNFVFNFVNYPNVLIEIPYNDCKLTHESTVYLDNDVEDNSDIPQRLFPTQFTRYTLRLTIDNAYMFSAPIKDNLLITSAELDIKNDKNELEDSSVIIVQK